MDFVNEQNVPRLKVGQDRRQITRLGQHRPRGHPEIDPQLARHNLCQRCLSQTRRAMEQSVVHRLAPPFRGFDEHTQIRASLGLTNEILKHLRAQGAVVVLGQLFGAKGRIGFLHRLSLGRQKAQRSADQG